MVFKGDIINKYLKITKNILKKHKMNISLMYSKFFTTQSINYLEYGSTANSCQ